MGAASSEQGYVREVEITRGLDSKIDEQVLERFRKRPFRPVMGDQFPPMWLCTRIYGETLMERSWSSPILSCRSC